MFDETTADYVKKVFGNKYNKTLLKILEENNMTTTTGKKHNYNSLFLLMTGKQEDLITENFILEQANIQHEINMNLRQKAIENLKQYEKKQP